MLSTHANIYVGALCLVALMYLPAGAFFAQVWRRQRADVAYLLLSLLTIVLAGLSAVNAASYAAHVRCVAGVPGAARQLALATSAIPPLAGLAVALFLHFTLRYVKHRHERWLTLAGYGAALACALAVVFGAWYVRIGFRDVHSFPLGVRLPVPDLGLAWPARWFYGSAPLTVLAGTSLLFSAYRAGRREALGVGVGALLLTLTVFNDAYGVALGAYLSAVLVPFGFAAFLFSVALTVVSRYAKRSRSLVVGTARLDENTSALSGSLAALRKAQDELVRAEQGAAVGELAATIAHEVRNPLAIIDNAVAGLRRGGLAAHEREELVAILGEELGRLRRHVVELVDYASPAAPQFASLDLGELVQKSLALAHGTANVRVTFERPESPVELACDRELLRGAFENVVKNAVEALEGSGTGEGSGTLEVAISRARHEVGDAVAVAFTDSGIGMSPETLARARTAFFTTRAAGTGLGLALSEGAVAAHGGLLDIASAAGRGTTVTITLPLDPERPLSPHAALEAGESSEPGASIALAAGDSAEPARRAGRMRRA